MPGRQKVQNVRSTIRNKCQLPGAEKDRKNKMTVIALRTRVHKQLKAADEKDHAINTRPRKSIRKGL